jgi:hypothetical protein
MRITQTFPSLKKNSELERFESLSSQLSDKGRFLCEWSERWPSPGDNTPTLEFEPQYTYHPAWAARILAKTRPQRHVDISSGLWFSTTLSAFIPMEFYDYRPAFFPLPNLKCGQADLLSLPFESNSLPSVSCMHVVEHMGLERYGDPFDPEGDLKAMSELQRIVSRGGQLLFVAPVGKTARIQYNAHRIFTYRMIIAAFDQMRLDTFSLIDDQGQFHDPVDGAACDQQHGGCGCWHFIKN